MVWSLINRLVVLGLERNGLKQEAEYLAQKTIDIISDDCREFYDPNDGSGHGSGDYAWTASHSIVLLLENLFGICYNGFEKLLKIKKNPNVSGNFRILGIQLGYDGYADIEYYNGIVSYEIHGKENIRTMLI